MSLSLRRKILVYHYGYYDDTLLRDAKSPSGWNLTGVKLTVLWRKGQESIITSKV